MDINQFQHAVVRDLVWVMDSPGLLDPDQFRGLVPQLSKTTMCSASASASTSVSPVVNDAYCQSLIQQHQAWLAVQDSDPTQLQVWLEERASHRLGYYFEALLEYWLAYLYQDGFMTKHIQVQRDKQTIGEFDFLFAETQACTLQHWEVAVKFYLYHRVHDAEERWYGPMTRDRLDLKLARLLHHQVRLSQTEEGRQCIAQLGYTRTEPHIFLKGYLFYPSYMDWRTAPHQAPGVAARHLRGWWTPLDHFHVPQQSADSRWIVIPRLRWLSPVIVNMDEYNKLIMAQDLYQHCRELLLNRAAPFLLAELLPGPDGCWREVDRGFVVGSGWPAVVPDSP